MLLDRGAGLVSVSGRLFNTLTALKPLLLNELTLEVSGRVIKNPTKAGRQKWGLFKLAVCEEVKTAHRLFRTSLPIILYAVTIFNLSQRQHTQLC
jgi:hypothetical protein